jgi:hypothetical protein
MPEPITEQKPEAIEPVVPAEAVPAVQVADNSDDENDKILDALLAREFPSDAQSTPPSPPVVDSDYERAMKALQRDGVPAEVIESIRSNPDKVKEWGLKAAKRQADVDAFGSRMSEQARKEPQAKTVAEQSPKKPAPAEADSVREFSEIFGEEAAKPLRDMQARMQQQMAEQSRAMEIKYESQIAYQSIKGEYGKSAPAYEKLMEVAAELGRTSPASFKSVDEIMRAAAEKLAGSTRKSDARDFARPTVGQSVKRVAPQVDPDDTALDILLAGGTRDDVRRVLSR